MSHSVAQAYNFRFDYASGVMGPFLKLQGLHPNPLDIPWCSSANKARELDYMYLGNRSGDKPSAPLIEKFIELATYDYLNPEQMTILASMYYDMYVPQLNKMWEVLNAEYNPLENYNMLENETTEGTNTGTVGHAESHSDSASVDNTSGSSASVYAFDSATATPTDEQESTSGTESESSGSRSDTRTDNLAHSEERELTRSGNIGTVTAQDMLQQELEIRQHDFYLTAFQFMDKILTIPVY